MICSQTTPLTLILIGIVSSQTLRHCSEEEDIGVFQLKGVPAEVKEINLQKTKAMITEFPKTIPILVTRRRRYTAYCYEGGNLDPNTGCQKKTTLLNPTFEEARAWNKKGICPTGWECAPMSECWGSDAQRCFDSGIQHEKGPNAMENYGQIYTRFAYHSCVSSWECNQHKLFAPLHIMPKGKRYSLYFTSPSGKIVDIENYDKENMYTDDEQRLYTFDRSDVNPTELRTEVTCFSRSITETLCVWTSPLRETITFNIDPETYSSVSGSYHLILYGNLLLPSINTDGTFEVKKFHIPSRQRTSMGLSSSLESLSQTVNSLLYVQMQSLYNLQSIINEKNSLQKLITNLISALSKKDSLLLGKVTGGSLKTNWISEDKFRLQRCNRPQWWNQTCFGAYIYKEGEFVKRKEEEVCGYYSEPSVKEFSLTNQTMYDFGVLHTPVIRESDKDSEAWQWLLGERYLREMSFDEEVKASVSDGNNFGLGEINLTSFLGIHWFSFITSIVTWLNTAILILICIKFK